MKTLLSFSLLRSLGPFLRRSRVAGAFVLMLLLGVSFSCTTARAQETGAQETGAQETGAVAGVVVDGQNGETLPGANVVVKGAQKGTSTGVEGRYRIEGLAPGTYDLEYSYVSYHPKTVTDVEVKGGETTTLDITLNSQTQELEEVVVTAEVARNSEAGLLRERQKAAAVSNAISAEAISASGSSNAADAMEKVSGASITGGKYVHVRGLGGRYVNTQLNGAELPSADPNGNAVQFDLFPAGLLKNIVTTKTFTPDQPGNFTGGNIGINTRSFPPELSVSFSSSVTYNSEVGYGKGFLGVRGGAEDVPEALQNGSVPQLTEAFQNQAKAEQLSALSKSFDPTMVPMERSTPVEQSYGLSFGNEFKVFGERPLGVIASLTYDQNVSGYTSGRTAQYSLVGDVSTASALGTELFLDERSGTRETLLGGLVNLSFKPHAHHELGVNLMYNRSEEQVARYQAGRLPRDIPQEGVIYETRSLHTTERAMRSLQGRGKHVFGKSLLGSSKGVRVKWNSSLSRSTQQEPDFRLFANQYDPSGEEVTYEIDPSIYPYPTRYFRDLSEDTWSNDFSVAVPLGPATLKAGGRYLDKSRTFRQRTFLLKQDQAAYQGDPEDFFGARAGLIGQDEAGRYRFGNYLDDQSAPSDNYDGAQTVSAGFAMIDTPVPGMEDLRVVGGVRMERTNQSVVSKGEDPQRGRIEKTDWLPSANLVYALTESMNARLAYGRTLARPSFLEFAPFCSFSFIGGRTTCGNAGLDRTTVDNFDARWEWFVRPGELLAVSGFYKSFDGPIERVIPPGDNGVVTYQNVEQATVYGLELEARKRLGFIAEPLQHLTAGANLALTHSEVSIAPEELALIRAYNPEADDTRALQGQAPYTANASLSYERPEGGTSVRLFYNVFGERLHAVANGPDLYEQPRHTLDLTASQRVGFGFEVKVSAKNLLGAEHRVTQRFKGQTFVNDQYPLGRSLSLGVAYHL